KIAPSGNSTSSTASAAAEVMMRFTLRRYKLTGAVVNSTGVAVLSGIAPRRHAAGDAPYQNLGQDVHDDGHQEKRQSDFHQRAQVGVAGGLAELVGDHAGHGIAGSKQRTR